MPLYDYRCDDCGYAEEHYHKMDSELTVCPACEGEKYHKCPSKVHTDLVEFHKPIEMHSVAANSLDEIREIQTKCPDVQISDNPQDEMYGIPIVKNRKEKMAVLKAVGFSENN